MTLETYLMMQGVHAPYRKKGETMAQYRERRKLSARYAALRPQAREALIVDAIRESLPCFVPAIEADADQMALFVEPSAES